LTDKIEKVTALREQRIDGSHDDDLLYCLSIEEALYKFVFTNYE